MSQANVFIHVCYPSFYREPFLKCLAPIIGLVDVIRARTSIAIAINIKAIQSREKGREWEKDRHRHRKSSHRKILLSVRHRICQFDIVCRV